MNTATVNSNFYDLTKEEMKALCPDRFRAIIRKAFDNKRSGMGPGPTMAQVIEHYEYEQTYRCIRGIGNDDKVSEILDTFFEWELSPEGSLPWTLPSIIESSNNNYELGRFKFTSARVAFPHLFEQLQAAGWYR